MQLILHSVTITLLTLQYTQLSKYAMTTVHEVNAARELIIEKEAT